jgi:hypothetical protein
MTWLLSDTVTGILAWVGTIGGLFGLYLTYRQASGARTAAQAANTAVQTLETRLNISNFAYATAQLGAVRLLIDSENFVAAVGVFGIIKRTILVSCNILRAQNDVGEIIALIRRNLQTIDRQLAHALNQPAEYRPVTTTRALDGITDALTDLESSATFGPQE